MRRTELAPGEGLEELQKAVLARIQDLRRLREVDGAHLKRPKREVAKQIVHIRPGELDWGRRVVVERRGAQVPRPLREELGDAGHVHVRLHERVVQALVRDIHLRDAQDVVDVGHDGDARLGHEEDGAVARPDDVQDARLHDSHGGAAVVAEPGDGDELVELAEVVGRLELDTGGVGGAGAVGEYERGEVRLGDRDRGEVLRAVLQ